MNKWTILGLLLAFTFVSFSPLGHAKIGGTEPSPWVETEDYWERSARKLGFGAMNTLTSWTSIFFELTREKNPLVGLYEGAAMTVHNTAGGAIQAVTFFLPGDVPLLEGGMVLGHE